MTLSRRHYLQLAGITACGTLLPAFGDPLQAARLAHRLDLWQSFSSNSQVYLAKLEVVRESQLLQKPIKRTAQLGIVAPSLWVYVESGSTGVRIIDDGRKVRCYRNADNAVLWSRHVTELDATESWLRNGLRSLFLPGRPESITQSCEITLPGSDRFDLQPPSHHPASQQLRSIQVWLDAKTGAVAKLALQELHGDHWTAKLSRHRQQVSPEEIAKIASLPAPA